MIYIVGTGPGEPDLLTLKAKRVIESSEIVFIPENFEDGRDVVENVIMAHVRSADIWTYRIFRKKHERLEDYFEMANRLFPHYVAGKDIVFAIPGDGTVYSTAGQLALCFGETGMEYEFIPGIPSFISAANASKMQLVDNLENMTICLLPKTVPDIKKIVDSHGTTVFMKISKYLPVLLKYAAKYRPKAAKLVHKASTENEEIFDLLAGGEIAQEYGYLSVAIIKK